jgi:type IV pilus assembly protein PilM
MGYGVDLGTTALKVLSVRRTLGGYKLVGAARRRVPKGAQDRNALLRLIHEAVGPKNGARAGVVGLSGRDINLQIVQQPAMKPANYRAMMGFELEQRKGQATDLYLDYCTLREPDSFFPQYLALVGIGKDAYVDDRIDLLAKTGLDVRDAVPNPFALYAAYRNAYDPEAGTILLLDVGSDNMDLAFVRGGRLIFARNVNSGARVFDLQLAGAMSCSAEDAEHLKVARANLGPPGEGEEDDELRGPVRSAAGQLAGFITSSINHAKIQLNDRELSADKIYLSGGGARVRGLAEYLSGALKTPVEFLDPFRKVDTKAVDRLAGGEEIRRLPTDLAVSLGLAQLVSPTPGTAASTLSILPEALKKRRNWFRTTFWVAAAGVAAAAALVALGAIAFLRLNAHQSALGEFQSRTESVRKRMNTMDELEREQRELSAKADALLTQVSGGRAALDILPRLKKVIAATGGGLGIDEIRLIGGTGRDAGERQRAAVTVRGRGLLIGELEPSDNPGELKFKGQGEAISDDKIVDGLEKGVIRWPAGVRGILVGGEVDENIRGEAKRALNSIRDQLGDPSRGVRAVIQSQKPSEKPGWRRFEILLTFE